MLGIITLNISQYFIAKPNPCLCTVWVEQLPSLHQTHTSWLLNTDVVRLQCMLYEKWKRYMMFCGYVVLLVGTIERVLLNIVYILSWWLATAYVIKVSSLLRAYVLWYYWNVYWIIKLPVKWRKGLKNLLVKKQKTSGWELSIQFLHIF